MSVLYYKGEPISVDGGNKPLTNLKICALGDSNTQYMADLNDRIVALTGCKSVTNLGYAGATWGNSNGDFTVTDKTSAIGRINALCNPYITKGYSDEYDIVTLMYGTNSDTSIGDSTSTSANTTWGAMKYCFDKLLYYFRYGKIGVLLPPQREGGVMTETVEAVKACCELYSVPYYDISGQGQIPSDTKMPVSIAEQNLPRSGYGQIYFQDNVHFSSIGKEQFYHKYARFLESLV